MITSRERQEIERKNERSQIRSGRIALIVACIAATAAITSPLLTWYLTERIRTSIQLDLLSLDRTKVEIASAAQRATEAANQLTASKLELDRQIAGLSQRLEQRKLGLEERRANTDETRLVTDFSKLVNDLRPNVEVSCNGSFATESLFKLECMFKNIGQNQIQIAPISFSIRDHETQKLVPNALERADNAAINLIPSGGRGSNIYDLYFTSSGSKVKRPIIQTTVEARTNQQAIDITRRLGRGNITDAELASVSTHRITFNLQLN